MRLLLVLMTAAFTALAPMAFAQLADDDIAAERRRMEKESGIEAPCAIPKPSDGAQVIMVRAAAEALSTVTIGSQDVATRTSAIVIEPGREPLYLVIASHRPTIWRISGAVERIEQFVLAGSTTVPNRGVPGAPPLIGATGVPRERVTFLRHHRCLPSYLPLHTWIEIADRFLKYETGRPKGLRGAYGALSEVSIPSGKFQRLRRGTMPMVAYDRSNSAMVIEGDVDNKVVLSGRNDLDDELKLFVPGGVVRLDAAAVVASAAAEPYEVLPQQAGLIQLMQAGALTRDDEGDFIVQRKIRLPAELNGGHKFRVRRGVEQPDGVPARVCVWLEETGAAMAGSRC